MEVPKRFMERMKKSILDNNPDFIHYKSHNGVDRLAKGLGNTLEIMDKDEANYVIENSYEELFKETHRDITFIKKEDWRNLVLHYQEKSNQRHQQKIRGRSFDRE